MSSSSKSEWSFEGLYLPGLRCIDCARPLTDSTLEEGLLCVQFDQDSQAWPLFCFSCRASLRQRTFALVGFPTRTGSWWERASSFLGKECARLGWALTQLIPTTLLPMGSGALLRMAPICR